VTNDQRHAETLAALQRLEEAQRRLEQLVMDVIAGQGDTEAMIHAVSMRFDEL